MRPSHILDLAIFASVASSTSLKETLSQQPSLSILKGLLNQFDLLDNFDDASNITLLAPTNQAYLDLAKWGFNVSEVDPFIARALLTYHVLDGVHSSHDVRPGDSPKVVHTLLQPPVLTNVTAGAAVKLSKSATGEDVVTESGLQVLGGVVDPDITFDNGVIHTLNSSLVLPHNISTTAELGGLSEFLSAMESAGLVSELEGQKDVTIFIPHNAAMHKLRFMMHLLSKEQLASVLKYHVLPGKVLYRQQVPTGESTFASLHGGPLHVHTDTSGQVHVNGAAVVREDMIVYGGVAHIIDEVLVPEEGPYQGKEVSSLSRDDTPIAAIPPQRPDSFGRTSTSVRESVTSYGHSAVTLVLALACLVLYVKRRASRGHTGHAVGDNKQYFDDESEH